MIAVQVKKTFWPPINADERRSEDCKDAGFNRRSSAFIGGRLWLASDFCDGAQKATR